MAKKGKDIETVKVDHERKTLEKIRPQPSTPSSRLQPIHPSAYRGNTNSPPDDPSNFCETKLPRVSDPDDMALWPWHSDEPNSYGVAQWALTIDYSQLVRGGLTGLDILTI